MVLKSMKAQDHLIFTNCLIEVKKNVIGLVAVNEGLIWDYSRC